MPSEKLRTHIINEGARLRLLSPIPNGNYADSASVSEWAAANERQLAKDTRLVRKLARFLRPGGILELGAGCGQLSRLFASYGIEVLATDFSPHFVDYMISTGLNARIVDATDIPVAELGRYPNILAQGPSPLLVADLGTVRACYTSIRDALEPLGRAVVIIPRGGSESTFRQHRQILHELTFHFVATFRHQVLPSMAYSRLPAFATDAVDGSVGRLLGIRHVAVLERPLGGDFTPIKTEES